MAVFTVSNLNDSGSGSLRQAIIDANNTVGEDEVVLNPDLSGTIRLTGGPIDITESVDLNFEIENEITIDGSGDFIFSIGRLPGSIIDIETGISGFSETLTLISPVTIFLGDDDPDDIEGGDALINGGGGNDSLRGLSNPFSDGDNTLIGGSGDDTLRGISGDRLFGGTGNDSLSGGDRLFGGTGNDTLSGGDLSFGGTGNDSLSGGVGDDTLFGNEGRDQLFGGLTGNDRLFGGTGKDFLFGDNQNDTLNGGNGNDLLNGNENNDSLIGGNGDDKLFGGTGDDFLRGGKGKDTLSGGEGNDIFFIDRVTFKNRDIIRDFENDIDKLQLAGSLSFSDLTIDNNGFGSTNIKINNNQIVAVLNNTDAIDIDSSDFI